MHDSVNCRFIPVRNDVDWLWMEEIKVAIMAGTRPQQHCFLMALMENRFGLSTLVNDLDLASSESNPEIIDDIVQQFC